MSRLPNVTYPAPSGMNSADDPVAIPPQRAQRLVNLRTGRAGQLRASYSLTDVFAAIGTAIDGVSWYFGEDTEGADDRLLFVSAGGLWVAAPVLPLTEPLTFSAPGAIGYGFPTGKRIRSADCRQETIFVAEGGMQPLRFNGTNLYQLGISQPAAPTVTAFGTGSVNGSRTYKVTLYDELGRESSPSSGTTVSFASQQALVVPDYGTDPQVAGAYLYRNTGADVYYRIANLTKPAPSYTDNDTDSTVNTGTVGPSPGQYDVPNEASCIAIHKNLIFLNDTTEPGQLQINNLDQPTHWASVQYVSTDGIKITVATDQGDPIVALAPFGSLLGVWKRRGFWQLWGDDVGEFLLRALHTRGTDSPDSCVRCDNVLMFLDEGKVWSADYQSAFLAHNMSTEIDDLLTAHTTAERQAAVGWYADNTYFLAIGTTIYQFDFTSQPPGWSLLAL